MNIKYIVIHHSASLRSGNSHQLEAINRYHRDKDWGNGAKCKISKLQSYVQYHYLIEPSGEVIKTAEENELRWHAGDYNGISLGICLTGNFDTEKPTQGQTDSLKRILIELEGRYPDAKIIYHRDIAKKTCPGLLITDDWAVNLLNQENMIVDEAKLEQIYQELLIRTSVGDEGAKDHLGKPEDEVRRAVGQSPERQLVITAINAGRNLNR